MHGIAPTQLNVRKLFLLLAVSALMVLLMVVARPQNASAAACAPNGDRGVVTHTLTNVTAGEYRVWSRMMSAGGGNDSYFLEIDGNTCYVVGDSTSISSSSWTWVDYQNGSSSNKINHTFSAGNHTVKLIGREDNVKLDRVMFLSNGCTPTGNGDNCAVVQNQAPTVSITSPANDATLSNSGTVTINANASDPDGSIQRVDFQIDDGPIHSDTTSGYSYSWSITAANNGPHTIKATAYDNEGQASATVTINVTVSIVVPDTTPPSVSLTQPSNGAEVTTGPVTLTATASDASGINRVEFYRGSTFIGTSTSTGSPYSYSWDISSVPNGSYQITARAVDNSSNANTSTSAARTITVNKPDVEAPTAPGNLRTTNTTQTSVSLAWNASTDNVGVYRYTVTRDGSVLSSDISGTNYIDTTAQPSRTYKYVVTARDVAGNHSPASNELTVNTPAPPQDTAPPSTPLNVSATPNSPSQITVAWSLSTDNVSVSKYRIYYGNGTLINEVNHPVASYGVTGLNAATSYSFYVVAVDSSDNVSSNSTTVNATTNAGADVTRPTISITSPSNNATVSGNVTIGANASDNVGVTKVEFYVGDTLVNTDTSASPGYSYSWNSGSVSNGQYSITAIAYDAQNNSRSASVNVTVNNSSTPPPSKDGDVNGDGIVGIADAIAIAINWGKSGMTRAQGDLNGDGMVGIADAIAVAINWGK